MSEVSIITVDVPANAAVLQEVSIPAGILVTVLPDEAGLRVTGEREHVRTSLKTAGAPADEVDQRVDGARYATLGHAFGLAGVGGNQAADGTDDEDEDDDED